MSAIKQPTYINREDVNEFLVDGVKNVHFTNGVVRMDLMVTRIEESQIPGQPPTFRHLTAGRVAFTAVAALQAHGGLGMLLNALKEHGQLPTMPTPVPPTGPSEPKH
jgi:hypothetical protein